MENNSEEIQVAEPPTKKEKKPSLQDELAAFGLPTKF